MKTSFEVAMKLAEDSRNTGANVYEKVETAISKFTEDWYRNTQLRFTRRFSFGKFRKMFGKDTDLSKSIFREYGFEVTEKKPFLRRYIIIRATI